MRFQKEYTFTELHEFSQTCYIKIEVQSKLNSKGKKAHWIGFDDKSSRHRIYDGSKISVERNIQFVEDTSKIEEEKIEQIQEEVKEILIERPKRERKATKRVKDLDYELNYDIYFTELFEFVNELIGDLLTYNKATKSPLSK